MNDECLICGEPLEYLFKEVEMECAICHKKEMSSTRCTSGHYVCNDCHMGGLDVLIPLCLESKSRKPIEVFETLVATPSCHTHGPEHHIIAGLAILTAYHNAGGQIDLPMALVEMATRGRKVPGGFCGFYGACGAAIASGIAIAIITDSTPLSVEPYALANTMTSRSLARVGEVGGPRCCKRNSYLSISEAVAFIRENLDVEMEAETVLCNHSSENNQCIKERCPFYKRSAPCVSLHIDLLKTPSTFVRF